MGGSMWGGCRSLGRVRLAVGGLVIRLVAARVCGLGVAGGRGSVAVAVRLVVGAVVDEVLK